MAPVKNPHSINKNSVNNNIVVHSNSTNPPSVVQNSTTAASNSSHAATGQRKQTGTVPKSCTKSTINANTIAIGSQQQQQQNGQKPLLQPTGVAQMANRSSPLNIVASIQHQQQQQQQQQHMRSHQQHKNTEIVAPIRRELKDLNDYLLTTVVTTANNTNNLNNQQQQPLQQLQTIAVPQQQQQIQSNTTAANSDFESSQENQQRFCYPVRPIPRRNQQPHVNQQTQSDFLNSSQNTNSNLNTAIGVVIPTTPGLPVTATSNTTLPTIQPVNTNSSGANLNDNTLLGPQFEQHLQLLVVQRLKQLFENSHAQPFLSLTSNFLPTIQSSSSANLANAVLNHSSNDFNQLAQRFQQTLYSNNNNNNLKLNLDNSLSAQQQKKSSTMVHEIPPNTSAREVVVNSTSLEDVPLSEISDRAQSIQSLHSNMETSTPETTPSYEELQQRLEASNRNIQNMQEQQQQLLKLQNAAKQHLSDMEKLREQAHTLSFPSGSQRGADGNDGAPDYQTIDQVHSDMASLVGRMKNLTTFIQNQNELSTLMGDDGPEILAEQELLQRKLEALRSQRDEMRNLVSELQNVNRSAEETAKEARQRQYEQEKDIEEYEQQNSPKTTQVSNKKPTNAGKDREVPVEYSRNVPIELLQQPQRQQIPNGNCQALSESEVEGEAEVEENEEQRKIAAALIQQKVADIDAMKAQLKRLKDMMETVNIIEAHTAKDPKLIGRTPPREVPITYDRERTPIADPSRYHDDNSNEEFIARKVRMLNEVTSDLRAQAQSLQSEKDRIQALKNEIERRKQQAAAAAQMGEDALKRNSLTPTPVPRDHNSRWEEHEKSQQERDQLKLEYELKKKEFEMLCKRLKEEEEPTPSRRQDIASEADDEAEEDNNDSDYAASTKFVPTSTPAATRVSDSANRNVKDSLNSTGASSNTATHNAQAASSTHDGASLEAASMQSGSSRSFSIPPPMSAMGMNFPGPIPPPLPTAWNPHQYYYATGVPPPPPPPQTAFCLNQTSTNTATLNTSECICNSNNLGAATSSSTATSAATNAPLGTNDPMLQQFIQTQQMLINSVCQCNQMLWHQQREIDSLNQTIHMLQERLLAITAGNVNATRNTNENGYGLRSESVPPASLGGIPTTQALPNNLFVGINRAQSEQPITFIPGQNRNSAFSNYQQQQQHQHVYRHQRVSQPHGNFNFTTESQQHNASASASTNMYATLNNAATQPPQASSTHFNNEIPTPQSPVVGSGPAPIFMHHHNNAIHQNNANLRTQNQQQQHHHSNLSHTLNNQVPPGNRANNYWDNFRSYSRQNLLSTNSTKSNEEQQLQQQQQQQQQQETTYERSTSLPHQQQPQHSGYNFHQQNQNLGECTNNLNYASNNDSNSIDHNKYLRIIQRSRINQRQQQQQYQQNIYQQQRDFLQQLNWLEQHENTNNNSSNTGSNTADLMYHNYNIQQSNKVGPKPNWRCRNLNEDYNPPTPINRHQAPTASALTQRYQNTLTTYQQQPIAQHFISPPQQQHLSQTGNQTATRNQDFLLRSTVDVEGQGGGCGDGEEVNYNFLNSHQQQQLPLDYSNPAHHNDNIILDNNENNEDEEEDDTTSEEIKRNLLVNALKNDKFTTKFYESIKEDVFRRLESMLLDKDNINNESAVTGQQHQQQQHLQHQQQLFNNITNISLRKLNLNEQRGQLMQQTHLELNTQQTLIEEPLVHIPHLMNNNESEQPLSSSNNDNNDIENEKPEEDTNWRHNNMNNCGNTSTNQTRPNNTNTTTITKNVTKKRKNLRKQTLTQSHAHTNTNTTKTTNDDDSNDSLRGACSLAAQQHQKLQAETKEQHNENKNDANASSSTNSPKSVASGGSNAVTQSNEYDLIKYIINRIRNQTHTNTLINDALLVDVAKLTATVAQNAQPLTQNSNVGNNATNLSPKKIYAKIKKLTLPKERDEFLRWYQKYLENTIFGNQQQQQQQRQQHLTTGEKGKSTTKPSNNQQLQQQQQNDLQAPNTDDGDLAEADQNCSLNNSSGNSGAGNGNDLNSTYHQQITADNNASTTATLHLIKTENFNGSAAAGLQYENNENPEETQTINIENLRDNNNTSIKNIPTFTADDVINSATPLQASKNLKSPEPASLVANSNSNNSEKSDLKCEKPEFTEKE